MSQPYLFYSERCPNSKQIIETLKGLNKAGLYKFVLVEGLAREQIPSFLKKVPTLYIPDTKDVIVGKDENELIDGLDPEIYYAQGTDCIVKRTSYNGRIRYNYAGLSYSYDPEADAFIAPDPKCGHPELFLNTNTYRWECDNAEHDPEIL
jgi:hypothetical protein